MVGKEKGGELNIRETRLYGGFPEGVFPHGENIEGSPQEDGPSYVEAYQNLLQLRQRTAGSLKPQTIRYFEELGLVASLSPEEFQQQASLREECEDLKRQEAFLRNKTSRLETARWPLRERVDSKWHRLWSGRTTLQKEQAELKSLEKEASEKQTEIGMIDQKKKVVKTAMMGEDQREYFMVPGTVFYRKLPISLAEEVLFPERTGLGFDPQKLLSLYSQTSDRRYARITRLGVDVLNKLEQSPLKNKENLQFNLALMERTHAFLERTPNLRMLEGINPERVVGPLLPEIIKIVEENLGFWSLQTKQEIKEFFASLTFPSAVPYLLEVLRKPSKVPMDVIETRVLGSESRVEDFDDEGTFGWCKGTWKITITPIERTYKLGYPVAEGAKNALLKINEDNPLLKEEIESVIRDFDSLPEETATKTDQETSKETLWSQSGSWK